MHRISKHKAKKLFLRDYVIKPDDVEIPEEEEVDAIQLEDIELPTEREKLSSFNDIPVSREYLKKEKDCKGKLTGYIAADYRKNDILARTTLVIGHKKPSGKYVAVYAKRKYLFFLYLIPIFYLLIPAIIIAAALIFFSGKSRKLPDVPKEDLPAIEEEVTEYDNEPIPFMPADGEDDLIDSFGEVSDNVELNVYAGEYTVTDTEGAIPLTNYAGTGLYEKYSFYDESGNLVYETDLLPPGTEKDFNPAGYVSKGKTNLKLIVTFYGLEDRQLLDNVMCDFNITVNYK